MLNAEVPHATNSPSARMGVGATDPGGGGGGDPLCDAAARSIATSEAISVTSTRPYRLSGGPWDSMLGSRCDTGSGVAWAARGLRRS